MLFVYSSNSTDHHDIAEMLSNLINIRSLIHLLSFTDMSQRVRSEETPLHSHMAGIRVSSNLPRHAHVGKGEQVRDVILISLYIDKTYCIRKTLLFIVKVTTLYFCFNNIENKSLV